MGSAPTNPELITEKLEVEPATKGMGTENCIVIKQSKIPTLEEVASTAVRNKAYIDNSGDEAGDDEYTVRFPGHEQETLSEDGISGRIRELLGEKE